MFSNLFSITLPNIEKYFSGIHFPKNTTFQQTNGALNSSRVRFYFELIQKFTKTNPPLITHSLTFRGKGQFVHNILSFHLKPHLSQLQGPSPCVLDWYITWTVAAIHFFFYYHVRRKFNYETWINNFFKNKFRNYHLNYTLFSFIYMNNGILISLENAWFTFDHVTYVWTVHAHVFPLSQNWLEGCIGQLLICFNSRKK